MPGDRLKGKPILYCDSQKTWSEWLSGNHADHSGVWLQLSKKGASLPSVTYAQAVEESLCYGWIDGQTLSQDESTYLQHFCKRRKGSIWSKINRDKVSALMKAGRVKPSGLAEVMQAQKEGRWDSAYDSAKTAEVPPDLAEALNTRPEAKAFFETLRGGNRYAILFRLQTAKKPETRQKRLLQFLDMLEKKETLH